MMKTKKNETIFAVFEDPDFDESIYIFEIPENDPQEDKIKMTSSIYKIAEQKAKEIKHCVIWEYQAQNGRLVNGKLKKRV